MGFKVVSDGTADGTKVYENGEERTDVLSVEREAGCLFVTIRVNEDDVEFDTPEADGAWGAKDGDDFFFALNHPV